MKTISFVLLMSAFLAPARCFARSCYDFQIFWDDQMKNHQSDWYHRPFPPEARQCWKDYMIPLTAAGDTVD